jgi:uncharacterized membrane protein
VAVRLKFLTVLSVLAAAVAVPAAADAAEAGPAAVCGVTELPGARGAGYDVYPSGTDDHGTFVGLGRTHFGDDEHGLMWRAGVTTDLGEFVPAAVNADGLMVGRQRVDGIQRAAVRSGGVTTFLPEPAEPGAGATDVNAQGDVVGYAWVGGLSRAVVWPAGTRVPRVLDDGPVSTMALKVDDRGFVLGSAGFAGDEVQTVYRLDGSIVRSFPVTGLGGHRATDLVGGVLLADSGGVDRDQLTLIDVVSGRERAIPDSTYAHGGVLAARGVVAATNRNGFPARWKYGRQLQLPQLGTTYGLTTTVISADGRQIAGESTDNNRSIATLWTCRN